MEKITECPVCESKSHHLHLTTKDYFLSNEPFSISACDQCGFLFTNPRPTQRNSFSYYKSEEYISHSDTSKGLINRIYKIVRNYALNQKTNLIKKYVKEGKALDIGCGTGHFLNKLSSKGFKVQGVEPGEDARNYAIKNFGFDVISSLDDHSNTPDQYQLISMWHVLEHVYTLNDHISKIHSLLSKDGILLVAVPNPESYDAKHYANYWAAFDLPRHLYHFSQNSIQQLFAKHNFDLISTHPMKFDSYYVSMLSEKYQRGKDNYIKAIWNGFLSNIKARGNNQNYSSLIYVFKSKIS